MSGTNTLQSQSQIQIPTPLPKMYNPPQPQIQIQIQKPAIPAIPCRAPSHKHPRRIPFMSPIKYVDGRTIGDTAATCGFLIAHATFFHRPIPNVFKVIAVGLNDIIVNLFIHLFGLKRIRHIHSNVVWKICQLVLRSTSIVSTLY